MSANLQVCKSSFLIHQMQGSPKKSFRLQTESHSVITTFEPSRIHFSLINKFSNRSTSAIYYDSTLPAALKEECEAVTDLFDYLQRKSPSEMQVQEDSLNFKVVRIKKERWYSIPIQQDEERQIERKEEEKMEVEVESQNSVIRQLTEERDELLMRNDQLKKQLERLQEVNQQLQARLQKAETQLIIRNQLIELQQQKAADSGTKGIIQEKPTQQSVMKRLTLASTHHNYRLENDIISKLNNSFTPLIFEERIKSGEKVYMSLQVTTELCNSWIIFGVKTRSEGQPFFFRKGCLAYSGSQGIIYNELDTIDLPHKPAKGDRMGLKLNSVVGSVEWTFNGMLICTHKMGGWMCQQDLYPYLMLSEAGNAVRINCDYD